MTGRPHRQDPLTPEGREEFEKDLVLFCDRELDRLGDLRGLEVLYAGGASLLWIEGLSQRVGERGSVTALDADEERIETMKRGLEDADLPAPVRLVVGDVSRPPFVAGSFDLVYSAGLFHELDVRERGAGEALSALTAVARPGGRVATGDFVDTAPAAQLEDERLDAEFALVSSGKRFFGIGAPERLVALHEGTLSDVRWMVFPPFPIRHLGKLVLGEDEPAGLSGLPPSVEERWRERRAALHDRVRHEGYTRPATLYVEGRVRGV
jgi:SAM-dependent methyltransferase